MIQLPESGVFNYTTVNIPVGVLITYKRNSRNTPVTILASGNVTISGVIDVSGGGGSAPSLPFGGGGLGGPGGFDGGRGGLNLPSFFSGLSGDGPGGGIGGVEGFNGFGCRGGGGGYAVGGTADNGCARGGQGGSRYGTKTLLPLIGGSGGGGGTSSGGSGGGGGGAIVIASSGTITFSAGGSLRAKGGAGSFNGSGNCFARFEGGGGSAGSGGAIRLIANTITGTAILDAQGGEGCLSGGYGYVRIEAFNFNGLIVDNSQKEFSLGQPGLVTLANVPTLRINSVGGVNAPASPSGTFHATPDITLPTTQTNPVAVALQAANIPLGTTIEVRLTPASGSPASVQSTPLTGTVAASTATASLTLPAGQSLIYATASIDLTGSNVSQLKPIFIEGERVRKIEVGANFGGKSDVVYVTETGRRVRLE
ncbi:MAG: hypothetical protein JNJ50_17970 [Acidobacteria bacterium]|nr:hypothetical protein [Acidobacteriota bacterium]